MKITTFSESDLFYTQKAISGQQPRGLEANIIFNDSNCSSPSNFVACTPDNTTSLEITNNGDTSVNCCLCLNLEGVMGSEEVIKVGENWTMDAGATGILSVSQHWSEDYFNTNYPTGYSGTLTYYVGWCELEVIHVTDIITFEITISPSSSTCTEHQTQQACETAGCYWWSDDTCHSTPEGGTTCSDHTTQAACLAAGCFWYQKYFWEDAKCHDAEQNMMMDYLPFIIAGAGGVIIVAALVMREKPAPAPAPYYPPYPPPKYPPPAYRLPAY